MEATKVGIREFRAYLAQYIASSSPVAVTRNGQTVGYFIPMHGQAEADLLALKKASDSLDELLSVHSVDGENIAFDCKKSRKKERSAASTKGK